ncbi:MAG TPA: glucose 1-dehydrogenase [Vicinamibacteria bacterium]|nr:glucose 1-dehydrogenase [Vicinamibacteria bacterium]
MGAVAVVPGRRDSLHVRGDVPAPRAQGDEVLVRVLETGVCGTDAEIHQGLYGQAPEGCDYLVLGHENLGRVDWCPAAAGLRKGDLVVSTVRRGCPERCRACVSDQNDMCLTGHFLERGIGGLHGFMCEVYAESPLYLVRLPEALRAAAVLLEPLSIVEKGVEQALRFHQRVTWQPRKAVVLGAGPVGLLAALVLRLRGLEVHVASRDPEGSARDHLLREVGVRYVSTGGDPDLAGLAERVGRIDVVFEATGATAVVVPSMRILGPNGVCILSSVTPGRKALEVDVAGWNREMVLGNRLAFGTVNAGRRHFEAGVRDMEAAEERFAGWLARLVTRRRPYQEAAAALEKGPDDVKVVLEFSR